MARKGAMSRKGRQTRYANRRTKKSTMTGGKWPFSSSKKRKELPPETYDMVINPLAVSNPVNTGSVPASAFGKSNPTIISVGTGFIPPKTLQSPKPKAEEEEEEYVPVRQRKPSPVPSPPIKPFNPLPGFRKNAMESSFVEVVSSQNKAFRRMDNSNFNPANLQLGFLGPYNSTPLQAPLETRF